MTDAHSEFELSRLLSGLSMYGRRTALSIDSHEISFNDLDKLSSYYSEEFLQSGAKSGDVVMFYTRTSIDSYASCIGALKIGLIISTTHYSFSIGKLRCQLEISGATLCICDDKTMLNVKQSISPHITVFRIPREPNLQKTLRQPSSLLAHGPDGGNSIAAIFFTSGSSGKPKGVQISKAAMLSAFRTISAHFKISELDNVLSASSLGSDFGFYNVVIPILSGACSTVLSETNEGSAARVLTSGTITAIHGMPPLIQAVASALQKIPSPQSLRYICSTGQTLSPVYFERIGNRIPQANLYMMYGMTECKRILCSLPYVTGSFACDVGAPVGDCLVHLIDKDQSIIEAKDHEGELVVHSRMLMDQYVNNTNCRDQFLIIRGKRFFRTGDIFHKNSHGNYIFHARNDRVFTRHGFKFDCSEIENTILKLGAVKSAFVAAQKDSKESAFPVAFVIPDETLSHSEVASQVVQYITTELDWQCVPELVFAVDEFPTLGSGKTDIGELLRSRKFEIGNYLNAIKKPLDFLDTEDENFQHISDREII